MCHGVWISERAARYSSHRVRAYTRTRTRAQTRAYTHVRMRKAGGDVYAWRLIIPREKMWSIAQQTKACRRLYNANSKNRGGLRGLRREETRGIVKRGSGRGRRRVVVTVKKQCGRACGYFKFAWHHRAQATLARTLRTLRLRTLRFFPPSQPSELTVLRFNLHTTDHVFRLAFTSSSSYLATIDQAPIVFASTHPLSPPRYPDWTPSCWGLLVGHYPTRTSLTRAHRLCVAPQQSRISLTSGSPSTDDIVPK